MATENNSFLVWGSRPLISSPLMSSNHMEDTRLSLRSNDSIKSHDLSIDRSPKSHDQKSTNENSPPRKGHSTDSVPAAQMRSSWQQLFGEISHTLIPCKDLEEYCRKIYDLLQENLESSRNKGTQKGGVSRDVDPTSAGEKLVLRYLHMLITPLP